MVGDEIEQMLIGLALVPVGLTGTNPAQRAGFPLPRSARSHVTRRRTLHLGAAIVCGALLTGCWAGPAHRIPGSDMALPTASYGDQLIATLLQQCEVSRIPASASEDAKHAACTRPDTALRNAGTVARGPARVP